MYPKKNCATCSRLFQPSSKHKSCPSCRNALSKNNCECGALKQKTSAHCPKCSAKARRGERGGNWKTGRWYHQKGYVMMTASVGRYIFEHVHIMEQHLGRRLYEGENVHHLNGIKDDNRPENLELWVKPQPSGIRAADALQWAKTIVERYDGKL